MRLTRSTIVTNLAKRGITSSSTKVNTVDRQEEEKKYKEPDEDDEEKDPIEVRVIRVEPGYRAPQKVDSRDSLAKACCGQRMSDKIYSVAKKSTWLMHGFFFAGMAAGSLGLIGVIPTVYSLLVVMTLPLVISTYLLMSRVLVKKLMSEWETMYMLLQEMAFVIAMIDAFRSDPSRVLYMLLYAATLTVVVFNDAKHPGSSRRQQRLEVLFYAMGLLCNIALIAATQLGFVKDIQSRKFTVNIGGTHPVEMDTLLFANYRLLEISFFFAKNAFLKLRYPDAFTVIKARVSSIKTTATALIAERPTWRRLSHLNNFRGSGIMTKVGSAAVSSVRSIRRASILIASPSSQFGSSRSFNSRQRRTSSLGKVSPNANLSSEADAIVQEIRRSATTTSGTATPGTSETAIPGTPEEKQSDATIRRSTTG